MLKKEVEAQKELAEELQHLTMQVESKEKESIQINEDLNQNQQALLEIQ